MWKYKLMIKDDKGKSFMFKISTLDEETLGALAANICELYGVECERIENPNDRLPDDWQKYFED